MRFSLAFVLALLPLISYDTRLHPILKSSIRQGYANSKAKSQGKRIEIRGLMNSLYFCVACESPGQDRQYVEVLARSEEQAIHKASRIHRNRESYRLLIPESVVKFQERSF